MKRLFVGFAIAGLACSALVALVSACTSNGSSAADIGTIEAGAGHDARATEDGNVVDPVDSSMPGTDSSMALSTCAMTRSYIVGCNAGKDAGDILTCGNTKFDSWCALNDTAINSEAYRRAETMCLTSANCTSDSRADCEAKSYQTATPTAAQKAIALAYCQTCEPTDTAGCVTRKTGYNAALGPSSTDDVFVAAWELNDALDDEIRTKCTGVAADAGAAPVASVCLKAFANCAGDIYVNHLPDCP